MVRARRATAGQAWPAFVTAWCDGGYTTDLPLEDLTGGRAWIAYEYGGEPLEPEHRRPARLLVPHLYFWKSAKWVRGLELRDDDAPGRPTATTTTAIPLIVKLPSSSGVRGVGPADNTGSRV